MSTTHHTDDPVSLLERLPRARPDALAHLTGESPRYTLDPRTQVRDLIDQIVAAVANLHNGRELITGLIDDQWMLQHGDLDHDNHRDAFRDSIECALDDLCGALAEDATVFTLLPPTRGGEIA